jgi:hypothetical protein
MLGRLEQWALGVDLLLQQLYWRRRRLLTRGPRLYPFKVTVRSGFLEWNLKLLAGKSDQHVQFHAAAFEHTVLCELKHG